MTPAKPKGNEMNNNDARRAHRIMDALCNGNMVTDKEREFLRSFLPERPTQKTLEEIAWDMHFAWSETYGNDWEEELFGDLESWLSDQHAQLRAHLDGVKDEAHPPYLETEADYENAPEGTIVAMDGSLPWHKFGVVWSCSAVYGKEDAKGMSKARRQILRWGQGNE